MHEKYSGWYISNKEYVTSSALEVSNNIQKGYSQNFIKLKHNTLECPFLLSYKCYKVSTQIVNVVLPIQAISGTKILPSQNTCNLMNSLDWAETTKWFSLDWVIHVYWHLYRIQSPRSNFLFILLSDLGIFLIDPSATGNLRRPLSTKGRNSSFASSFILESEVSKNALMTLELKTKYIHIFRNFPSFRSLTILRGKCSIK